LRSLIQYSKSWPHHRAVVIVARIVCRAAEGGGVVDGGGGVFGGVPGTFTTFWGMYVSNLAEAHMS